MRAQRRRDLRDESVSHHPIDPHPGRDASVRCFRSFGLLHGPSSAVRCGVGHDFRDRDPADAEFRYRRVVCRLVLSLIVLMPLGERMSSYRRVFPAGEALVSVGCIERDKRRRVYKPAVAVRLSLTSKSLGAILRSSHQCSERAPSTWRPPHVERESDRRSVISIERIAARSSVPMA